MSFTYGKLRGRIIELYNSLTNFSSITGIPYPTVCSKLSGKYGFSQEDIIIWSKWLNISTEEYVSYFFMLKE